MQRHLRDRQDREMTGSGNDAVKLLKTEDEGRAQ